MLTGELTCDALGCVNEGCFPGPASAVWALVAIGLTLEILIFIGNGLLMAKFVWHEAANWNFRTPGFDKAKVLGKAPPKGVQLDGEHGGL